MLQGVARPRSRCNIHLSLHSEKRKTERERIGIGDFRIIAFAVLLGVYVGASPRNIDLLVCSEFPESRVTLADGYFDGVLVVVSQSFHIETTVSVNTPTTMIISE